VVKVDCKGCNVLVLCCFPSQAFACVASCITIERVLERYRLSSETSSARNPFRRSGQSDVSADNRNLLEAKQLELYGSKDIIRDIQTLFEMKSHVEGAISIKSFRVRYISRSCHQCTYQCVWYPCTCTDKFCEHVGALKGGDEGTNGECSKVICSRCAQEHYAGLKYSIQDLQTLCPPCRGICNCRRHMRQTSNRAF
jgi:hypothetical protein